MAGGYGSEKNGVSLGVFWDSISLNSDGSQARIVGAEIRIHRDVNISDSTNKLSWSGGAVADGSASNINVSGSGNKTIKSVTGQWQDLAYGSTKSASFSASMSGVDYAGGTISVSKSITYPARAYKAPVAPTNLEWTQTSIGNFTLSWTNQHSEGAPWTTVVLVRTEVGGATTEITVPNPTTATSITQNGMALDKRYTWYLRITNPTSTVASAPTSMTPIPLHSMSLSASSVAIGDSVTFTVEKYGSSNTSTLYFIKNGVKTIILDKTAGTSYTYTLTQADWAAFLPTETSKDFVVGIETFAGTTSLGVQTQNLTITVPEAAPYLPDATAPTRSEQATAVGTAFGVNVFVKNKSRIRYTWVGSAGASATITKREILITRAWQSGTTIVDVTSVSGYLYEEVPTGNGVVTVASRTTDSRGRVYTSDNATFTVYNYVDPVITTFSVTRCDSAGNTNNSGTYVKFTIDVTATSVNPGSEANQMQYRIRLLDSSGNETGSDLYAKALNSTLTASLTTGALGAGAYSAQAGYSFRLTLNDDLTNATSSPVTKSASISSEVYPLTIGNNGIAIGKVYNDSTKALDVVGHTLLTGNLDVTGTVNLNLGGENINSGTIPEARIPVLTEAKIPVLTAAKIPSLDAEKTTSGTFAIDRIPIITPDKMTAATDTDIGAVERATDEEVLTGTDTTRYTSPASIANLLKAVKSTGTISTTPAGTLTYYLYYDESVELFWASSGNVASDTQYTIATLNATLRPRIDSPLAAAGGLYGDRPAGGTVFASGPVRIRNQYSTAVAIRAHAYYRL